MKVELKIKPLSVNECWKGRRFKTDIYKFYEKEVLLRLPLIKLPSPPYRISFEFGLSNTLGDFDNPIKPLTDILQKKYGFNDRDIYEANIKKVITVKGAEYFQFEIETIEK